MAEATAVGKAIRHEVARTVRGLFETTPGVVDVQDSMGLKGIPAMAAVETARRGGRRPGCRPDRGPPDSREPVPVRVRLSAADRARRERRLALRVDSPAGGQVSIGELARVERAAEPQPLVRKDLKPVVYVMGDLAGEKESPVYAILALDEKLDAVKLPDETGIERYSIVAPRPPTG